MITTEKGVFYTEKGAAELWESELETEKVAYKYNNMEIFNSFLQAMILVENQEKNLRAQGNSSGRLDGKMSGGNPKAFVCFDYDGLSWKINYDTHFYRLRQALDEIKQSRNPFVAQPTPKGRCLTLRGDLIRGFKHLYIYAL